MTVSRTEQRWVLCLTSACALMVALDQLVVSTALTTMQRSLHCSLATLEWTVNAYSLSFAVLLMTAAALGDRWGRRRVLVARAQCVHRGVGGVRPRAQRRLADRRAGGAGCRLGGRHAAGDGHPDHELSARAQGHAPWASSPR